MVRVGSKATVWQSAGHFRSTPINRHSRMPTACLKGAKFGSASFDQLVGAGEKHRWDLQAQFFGRWLVNHQFELRGGLNRKIG
jgi:hypothetical protein